MGERHIANLYPDVQPTVDSVRAEFQAMAGDVHERLRDGEVDFEEASCMLFSLLQWRFKMCDQLSTAAPVPDEARGKFVGDLMQACWV